MSVILEREGAEPFISGWFYVAIVQAILLFGAETWVVTPRVLQALEGFHHRAARQMAGMGGKRLVDGTWEYPPIDGALAATGLARIVIYLERRQNKITEYVATRPVGVLCMAVKNKRRTRKSARWWDQPGVRKTILVLTSPRPTK